MTTGDACPQASPFALSVARRHRHVGARLAAAGRAILREARHANLVYATGMYTRAAVACAPARTPLVLKLVNDPAFEQARARGLFHCELEEFDASRGLSLSTTPHAARRSRWACSCTDRAQPLPRRARQQLESFIWAYPCHPESGACRAGLRGPRRFAPHARHAPTPTAVFAGRFVEQKNVPLAVEALARSGVDAELALIGDGPSRSNIFNTVASHGLEKRVRFIEPVSRTTVLRWLYAADEACSRAPGRTIRMQPSRRSPSAPPVIATAVGGVTEIVTDGLHGRLHRQQGCRSPCIRVRRDLGDDAPHQVPQRRQHRDTDTRVNRIRRNRGHYRSPPASAVTGRADVVTAA